MRKDYSATAILFFTRQAAEEAAAKKFTRQSGKSNRQIATHLIKQTQSVLRHTPFPVFTSSGDEFAVSGFGAKLSAAVETVFNKGYENVIIVGNDCPTLTPELILKAEAALQTNAIVLGPTKDKGVYLIGLNRAAFNKESFALLPWQTGEVLATLQQYVSKANRLAELLPWQQDINSEYDLARIIHQLGNISFIKILQSIFVSFQLFYKKNSSLSYFIALSHQLPNRAPPLVFSR